MTAARINSTWQRAGPWGLIALLPGEFLKNPDPVTYLSAVAAFESAGNQAAAETAYQAALEAWPDHPSVRFALANNFLDRKKHAAAIQLYQHIVAADPEGDRAGSDGTRIGSWMARSRKSTTTPVLISNQSGSGRCPGFNRLTPEGHFDKFPKFEAVRIWFIFGKREGVYD